MIYLPRIERKIEIKASQKLVYDILYDSMNFPVWNIVVNEITEIGPDKFFTKTNVGDMTATIYENIPNERVSSIVDGSPVTKMGEIIITKGDTVEVNFWCEFENEKDEKMLGKAADIYVQCLKKYTEFIEGGGAPDNYDKKKALKSP